MIIAYRAEYVLATELSNVGTLVRVGAGIDPYTGEKLSKSARIEEALRAAATFGAGHIIKSTLRTVNSSATLIKIGAELPDIVDKTDSVISGLKKEFKKNE